MSTERGHQRRGMFEVVGEVSDIEVIATGRGIKRLKHLRKRYGGQTLAKTEREDDGSA